MNFCLSDSRNETCCLEGSINILFIMPKELKLNKNALKNKIYGALIKIRLVESIKNIFKKQYTKLENPIKGGILAKFKNIIKINKYIEISYM